MEETFLLFFVERLRIMDCVVLCFDHSGAPFPKLRCRTSVACNLPPTHGLHFGLLQTSYGHALGTLTAEPEVFQRFAAVPRGHGKDINLSITQVAEFTPAVRIGTLADHHALSRPSYACTTELRRFVVAGIGNHMARDGDDNAGDCTPLQLDHRDLEAWPAFLS